MTGSLYSLCVYSKTFCIPFGYICSHDEPACNIYIYIKKLFYLIKIIWFFYKKKYTIYLLVLTTGPIGIPFFSTVS